MFKKNYRGANVQAHSNFVRLSHHSFSPTVSKLLPQFWQRKNYSGKMEIPRTIINNIWINVDSCRID